ncbi:MAG: cytochrome c3 family protein [Calditrichia bacterium]
MKILTTLFFILSTTLPLAAQLSPGDLSKPHENLEGLKNCTECHAAGQRISPEKCLDCHKLLKQRVRAGEGLHARPDYNQCQHCHVEHQGRDYELIWWENGRDNFDHSQTGYVLEGKHRELECRQCHKAAFISEPEKLREQKKQLDRTFLGLKTECLNCHFDEHRGQVSSVCSNCHGMDAWKPAPKFDHSKSSFPLTGKHTQVKCEKCHPVIPGLSGEADKEYLKLTNLKFRNCGDCHTDPHQSKLGNNCAGCHQTGGWQQYNSDRFSHDQTAFPLLGKHAGVQCRQCHPAGQPIGKMAFGACRDCHSDYHKGEFAERADGGACEVCHTVHGFKPAKFTIADHNQTGFPLKGAHLAVACIACHKPVTGTIPPRISFRFASTTCNSCHGDPHKGQVDQYWKINGCEFCHSVESWQTVQFDHSKTEFPLLGQHEKTSCRSCHLKGEELQFTELSRRCESCHQDPHFRQFATQNESGDTVVNCRNCHTPQNWLADKFDHNKDAAFSLKGAHQYVACAKCHPVVEQNDQVFVRYKPLETACSSCHGPSKSGESSG